MTTHIHITPPPLSSQSMADLLCTIVLLCRGKDMYQRDFWAYMCIKPSMAEAFQKACESGSFNLGEYGTILEAGEGTEVPTEIRERMTRDYDVKHDFEEQMHQAILQRKNSQNA